MNTAHDPMKAPAAQPACAIPDDMLDRINERMHEGSCPTVGCLGECPMIEQVSSDRFLAMLYIWDDSFNDSAAVAGWFHQLGATGVSVALTLYSDWNGDRDGKTEDGCREWEVYFSMPATATEPGSPEGQNLPQQGGDQ